MIIIVNREFIRVNLSTLRFLWSSHNISFKKLKLTLQSRIMSVLVQVLCKIR